mmetsp:Transcript_22061/g.48751  ORF Transcript_22061/g.48751 Transcript_22061/m.48751 type:complete len:276 (-) Transcript_22061:105-932(-)
MERSGERRSERCRRSSRHPGVGTLLGAAAFAAAAVAAGRPLAWLWPAQRSVLGTQPAETRQLRRPSEASRDAVLRRARVDGEFGVLPDTASPEVDASGAEDPVWERLIIAVQAADQKRGVDISAFWIHEGWDIMVIVTALSRPQLQAVTYQIESQLKQKLRLRQSKRLTSIGSEVSIRNAATAGWTCLNYPRLQVHVMTPVQRAYFDLEALWRDEHQDYEEIDVSQLLREDSFGGMRLTSQIPEKNEPAPQVGGAKSKSEFGDENDEDEDDPFWS